MGLDQIAQFVRGEAVARDRLDQRRRDRIGARFLAPFAVEDLAPPLQPDFTGQRFSRQFAHPRDFHIERKKRMERAAAFRGREQRSDEAVPIGRPHQLGAIGECILHEWHHALAVLGVCALNATSPRALR